jgi:hypothetical protein
MHQLPITSGQTAKGGLQKVTYLTRASLTFQLFKRNSPQQTRIQCNKRLTTVGPVNALNECYNPRTFELPLLR